MAQTAIRREIAISQNFEWLVAQIEAGVLPDVMYAWTPINVAVRQESAGRLVIVCWPDPITGRQYWITKEKSVLTAPREQWAEAVYKKDREESLEALSTVNIPSLGASRRPARDGLAANGCQ